jgi:hypothetical protein
MVRPFAIPIRIASARSGIREIPTESPVLATIVLALDASDQSAIPRSVLSPPSQTIATSDHAAHPKSVTRTTATGMTAIRMMTTGRSAIGIPIA